jgi:ABC-type enterochelin transport system substrate-binding protein
MVTYLENVVIVVVVFDVGLMDDFDQLGVSEREPVASV